MPSKTVEYGGDLLIPGGEFAARRGCVAVGCRQRHSPQLSRHREGLSFGARGFGGGGRQPLLSHSTDGFKSDPKIRGMICLRVKPNA